MVKFSLRYVIVELAMIAYDSIVGRAGRGRFAHIDGAGVDARITRGGTITLRVA